MNLGVRYEYVSPLVDNLNRRSTFWPLTNDYNTGITPEVLVADPELLHDDHAAMRRGRVTFCIWAAYPSGPHTGRTGTTSRRASVLRIP